MLAALVLALGVAMDAAAVAAARGLLGQRRELVVLPLLFGLAQAGMASIGWGLGDWGGHYVAAWDHWIAFALLSGIGIKMILESRKREEPRPGSPGLYLVLALATSIDAAAAGITLTLLPVAPWISLVLIGAVTAVCAAAGYVIGRRVGDRVGPKLDIAGGVILVGLGIKILVEHL